METKVTMKRTESAKVNNGKLSAKDSTCAVSEYIAGFPAETASILSKIRSIIKDNAPDAIESMAYNMPAYKLEGEPLIYFAGFKNHIGLYALPTAHEAFATELSKYVHGKGSVQFPLNEPMPYDVIIRIILFRVNEITGTRS